jgi:hypothetical protein
MVPAEGAVIADFICPTPETRAVGRKKHSVGIFESSYFDTIDPNNKSIAKGLAGS